MDSSGIAIVTGASSGLGEAFARELAGASAGTARYGGLPAFDELWLVARRADRLDSLAAELCRAAPGLTVRAVATDLVAPGAIESLAAKAAETGKPLRVVVNNAGYGTYGNLDDTDTDRLLGQVDLNCRALTECCARFSPLLASGSVVINVASLAAFAPLGGFAAYAASKAYALSLSVGLSAEWKARGISVCALCPGPVATEFSLVASGGARKEVKRGWPADKTARACLRDAIAGAWISMPRPVWRLRRLAGWLAGPELSASFAYRFMKRPSAPSRGDGA
ncbi:MAG: SDR family NAD(P)-dependent oxidoreductase [Spirochaetaceae bacterium]|nr:SDR family NAD(P)-dependent oxidoreductase [Spirochaetaceae bacterium]HPE89537.1 SDR family NAD(P)-dependent oxidoreductase [Spirochaetales bacterium]